MKIITYLRISTDEQTLEPQRLELAGYIQRQGWTHVAEFTDIVSGAKASRAGLDSMLSQCAGIDAVLVVKLDRLGRSVLNVVSLVQRLAGMGVAVICTSQGIDTRDSNPCGKMILSIMAAFAEFERDIIRERTRAGLKVARANGKMIGRVSPTMVAGPERAAIVNRWRAAGGKNVRELGRLLGGVSGSTAWRVAKTVPLEAVPVMDED